MIYVTAYKHGQLHEDLSLEAMTQLSPEWYWVDFSASSEDELAYLYSYFDFHPLAIEDCLHDLQRPKLDYYENHSFLVLHAIDAQTLAKQEIDVFLGDCFIVTYHQLEQPSLQHVKRTLHKSNELHVWEEYYVLYQILDKVVDNYFPIIYAIEDHINEIEDNTKNLSMDRLLEQLFERRSELLTLRQTVHPMRDLLYRVLNTHHLQGVKTRKEYFTDIYDHLLKVAENIASNRELTQDIRDSYLSLNAHETNRTMQVLTIISVIFMPLTFIVGVYGMNFTHMPELDERYAYLVVWMVMVTLAVGMYLWFKRKGWFDK
ncbi:magnesium/cobalt transporter CorA [Thalassobacillus sp. CUG 92003]|uniref:magnesium/cobalt transporter CorA n=1 Tax=Thalassobacillus sp. CUG 92003 TaxID=2736641 RepID=UPI00210664D5|nr:magnesium/cobalt transporter CorA [Thalassobacillus sp. CUG 92003]